MPGGEGVPKRKGGALNPRERQFVYEYLKDFNATKAAIRAGYSERTARQIGSENLSKPDIQAAIAAATDQMLAEAAVSVGRVIREYSRIAFSDLTDLVQWDAEGNVTWTPSEDLDEAQRALIGEFTQTITEIPQKGGEPIVKTVIKAKYHDKMAALAKLFEYQGLAKQKVEHTGKDGGPIQSEAKVLFYIPENGRDESASNPAAERPAD